MITVYGASDDLIEVEGEIEEEFYANNEDKKNLLVFSDGTILSIRYDNDGMWRINRIGNGESEYSKVEATDTEDNYSDKVTLTHPHKRFRWVVFGSEIANTNAK